MHDKFGRRLHYLRVSVTDRCNLRCRYCMPETGVDFIPHEEILTYDEIVRVVRIAAALGIDRVRLTGGEPLVRKGVADLAAELKRIDGIRYLGLTTNGMLLPPLAGALKRAGVDGVNVSVDTLDPARFRAISGRDGLPEVLAGLESALSAGFPHVKVNCVLGPDSVPEDWLGVAGLADRYAIDVRFIEWMPMGGEAGTTGRLAEAERLLAERFGRLKAVPVEGDGGPAVMYKMDGRAGRIGFIAAISHAFCDRCNRLRLTSTGDLKLCLFYDTGVALKRLLRGGASDDAIRAAIETAVTYKPEAHQGRLLDTDGNGDAPRLEQKRGMYKTGG